MQKEYLEEFKTYLSFEKNYSANTVKGYESDITSFLIWLKSDCLAVDLNKLREYIHFIQQFNYKKNTILRKISSIRGFYKYLNREKIIAANPADALIAPKKGKPLPKFLTDDEMEKILLSLDFGVKGDEITVPTHRYDIAKDKVTEMNDIAEEIARVYGYNKLPSTIMNGIAVAKPTEMQRFTKTTSLRCCLPVHCTTAGGAFPPSAVNFTLAFRRGRIIMKDRIQKQKGHAL